MRVLDMDSNVMRGLSEIKEKGSRVPPHLEEGTGPRHWHSPAEAPLENPGLRGDKESRGKETYRMIVEVAERLFRQLGFQKTTVADIARELHMSPANVYRFFAAKSEINAAVCRELLCKIEAEAEKIAQSRGTAGQKIRTLIASVEKSHHKRFVYDRKLHELVEAAASENWAIMSEHNQRMAAILEQIIANGMAAGEIKPGDAALAAGLVNTACIRFCHPRLMVEYNQRPQPGLDQMIDFCLSALIPQAA
jgi:AcrR family transcriptional regulator